MFRVKWFRSHLGLLLACGAMAEAIRAHLPACSYQRAIERSSAQRK